MVVAAVRPDGKFFWNLSAKVGPGQPNKPDDVDLVRFGFICIKLNPKLMVGPRLAMKPLLDRMRPFGPFDTDLAEVIVAEQKIRGGTQDRIISPAHLSAANKGSYDGGGHTWLILPLNNNMSDIANSVYPRIDKHPQSGPSVSVVVEDICVGGS
jgi:hypothetical protein